MDRDFRRYFMQMPEPRLRQCMMGAAKPPFIRCNGVAEFTVENRHGELKDVCHDCLPVICLTSTEHDPLVVMKLLEGFADSTDKSAVTR